MFADDINLFLSNKDINKLFNDVNVELRKMSIWFKANNFFLNLTKTKWKLFHSQKKNRLLENDLPIGIYIDKTLTWKYHVEHVCNKVSKKIGTIYKSRNILGKRLMKQLYFSFNHNYLNYANIA